MYLWYSMVTLWMIGWFIGLGVLATEGVNTPSFAEHRFSRMRSKGSRFTLGVWGLRVCSLDVAFVVATVRNRSQPFATVRNRPQPSVRTPYGKFCRGGHFLEVSNVSLFRFAWQAWHFVTFRRVLQRDESRLRGRRNTFATFSEDVLQFSWQAQHFGRVHRHSSWQAQHFRRIVLRVLCKSHWQGCVKWRQGGNSVAVVAFCAMCWNWRKPRTKHRFWGCKFSGSKENA